MEVNEAEMQLDRLAKQAKQVNVWLRQSPDAQQTAMLQTLLRQLWDNYDSMRLWSQLLAEQLVLVRQERRARRQSEWGAARANTMIRRLRDSLPEDEEETSSSS
jgi:hypothetical protein